MAHGCCMSMTKRIHASSSSSSGRCPFTSNLSDRFLRLSIFFLSLPFSPFLFSSLTEPVPLLFLYSRDINLYSLSIFDPSTFIHLSLALLSSLPVNTVWLTSFSTFLKNLWFKYYRSNQEQNNPTALQFNQLLQQQAIHQPTF